MPPVLAGEHGSKDWRSVKLSSCSFSSSLSRTHHRAYTTDSLLRLVCWESTQTPSGDRGVDKVNVRALKQLNFTVRIRVSLTHISDVTRDCHLATCRQEAFLKQRKQAIAVVEGDGHALIVVECISDYSHSQELTVLAINNLCVIDTSSNNKVVELCK